MRVLALGGDGYLGRPKALHFLATGGHLAVGANLAHRGCDLEMGVDSLVAPAGLPHRRVGCRVGLASRRIAAFGSVAIVHIAEQRSAPSMVDHTFAVYTQGDNVVGTVNLHATAGSGPGIPLVGWAATPEDGRPSRDSEPGSIGRHQPSGPHRRAVLPHGRSGTDAGVSDCPRHPGARAVGTGHGQPAGPGEFRVCNRFTESFSVNQLVEMVSVAAGGAEIAHLEDPRARRNVHRIEFGPVPSRASRRRPSSDGTRWARARCDGPDGTDRR
jgi:hypothetical protein